MAIVQIELEAVRTDKYRIDIDPDIINDAWLEEYRKKFSNIDNLQELATNLAFQVLRFDTDTLYEGFGYVKMFYSDGTPKTQFKGNLTEIPDDEYLPGITLTLLCHDNEHDFNTISINAATA